MPELVLPRLKPKPPRERVNRSCPGHRAWVRRHDCSVRSCKRGPIECAHVRSGTDGGAGSSRRTNGRSVCARSTIASSIGSGSGGFN